MESHAVFVCLVTHCCCCRCQVKAALAKIEREEREALAGEADKRKFNSLGGPGGGADVTPEEMEAWRIKRSRGDDPMAAVGGTGAKAAGGYEFL
jgi:pre-mRNA-processing factor SLU7